MSSFEIGESFRRAIDTVPALTWIAEGRRGRTFFNRSWLDWTGRPMSRLTGQRWRAAVHPEDLPELDKTLTRARRRGQSAVVEYRLRRVEGPYQPVREQIAAVRDDRGAVVAWIGTAIALESRVWHRSGPAELEAAKGGRPGPEFFHELEGALVSIKGYIARIRAGSWERLAAQNRHDLERVEANVIRISRALAEPRAEHTSAKQESGVALAETERILTDAVEDIRAAHPTVDLHVALSGRLPTIHASPNLVRLVFANLISNAAKYGASSGGVHIEVGCRPVGDAWEFFVRDSGPGIGSEDQDRIFKPFERLPSAVVSGVSGSGLGLPIAKRAVEQMGGEIRVESLAGEGATVYFTVARASSQIRTPLLDAPK